jgi:hypothetical protein
MSTALYAVPRPEVSPVSKRLPGGQPVRLTTSRITSSHHGRTLRILGHAAEYLANSRRFMVGETSTAADDEAVRILMRSSSAVFREYADNVRVRRPVEDFVMGLAALVFE